MDRSMPLCAHSFLNFSITMPLLLDLRLVDGYVSENIAQSCLILLGGKRDNVAQTLHYSLVIIRGLRILFFSFLRSIICVYKFSKF